MRLLWLPLSLAAPCLGLRALQDPDHRAALLSRAAAAEDEDAPRRVQAHLAAQAVSANLRSRRASQPTCTTLKNHGTHFTARIAVGTPPQPFDVVADTGSDSVIVASCYCMDTGKCEKGENKCFKGSSRSSTFTIPGAEMWNVPVVTLAFGSGQIDAVVATDVVRVGSAEAKMDNGMLLMVNQALQMNGPFEGILGLGLPRSTAPPSSLPELYKANHSQAPVVAKFSQSSGEVHVATPQPPPAQLPTGMPQVGQADSTGATIDSMGGQQVAGFTSLSFIQAAGIQRFSMCFNDGSDGVLRLGQPKDENALGSIGKVHWGLELAGITVGSASATPVLCGPDSKRPGQATACGAIPDSGTTVMMGPAEHLLILYASLCDQWARCRSALSSNRTDVKAKAEAFRNVLWRCSEWLEEEGLEGLPSLRIALRGSEGNRRELVIPPHLYVLQTQREEIHQVKKKVLGIFSVKMSEATGVKKKVCGPAFSTMDYHTAKNGPIWILGTSIFYAYQVGYDLYSSPPSISFATGACGSCSQQTSFFASSNEFERISPTASPLDSNVRRMPRVVDGPLLSRNVDVTQPL